VSASGRDASIGSHRATARVVILGAAGRDFHNFNVVYRDDPHFEVVAFTAAQIPDIAGRRYPAALAGARYPDGIPILQEAELEGVCRSFGIDQVVFAYSDVPHAHVMHLASRALAAGADFVLLGPQRTMLAAHVPVITVSAVWTGCGKSQTARWISRRLRARGLRVAVIRHPMPYGDLERQAVQRFADRSDLVEGRCTLEEREEYEPHIAAGNVVYAGVDYARVVAAAQAEADVIVWDGGNNDFPFVRPGLHIVLVDPLRPGHETDHHPGETVLRMADVIVIAKTDAAAAADVQRVAETARRINSHAPIVRAASPIRLEPPDAVRGKRVLVVEDGPTTTHGGMAYGAGYVAAVVGGAASIVHPQPFAVAEIARLYDEYPHLGPVLPAMGYSAAQLDALARSIDATPADVVVSGTPIDLAALVHLAKPVVRARYEFAEAETPGLGAEIDGYLARAGLGTQPA
jgi:predicted GTPase